MARLRRTACIVASIFCLAVAWADTRDVKVVGPDDVPDNPLARFDVAIRLDKPTPRYRIGEHLTLRLQAEKSCYLTIFDVGTSGNVTLLLPNRYRSDTRIEAGKAIEFPGEGDGFEYEVTGPTGVDRIVVVATLEKVDLGADDLEKYHSTRSLFKTTPADKAGARMVRAAEDLRRLPDDQWATDQVAFTITNAEEPPKIEPVSREPQSWALAIGVKNYPAGSGKPKLFYADRDAVLFGETLRQQLGLPDTHVVTKVNEEATREAVRRWLDWLAENAGADDRVFLYFSGHGSQQPDMNGDESVGRDGDDDGADECLEAYDGPITDDDLWGRVDRIKCAQVVEVIDTCFAGGLHRSIGAGARAARKAAQDFVRGLGPGELRARTRSIDAPVVCFMAACQPNQVAKEDPRHRQAYFTYFITEGIRGSGDGNADGMITAAELHDFTHAAVLDATRGQQEPILVPDGVDLVITDRRKDADG